MYDTIIVGARCAGSPLAAILARAGLKVLLLDRGSFPSDIISTHFIHAEGVAFLDEWGVGDAVRATNCPPLTKLTMHFGDQVMVNEFVGPEGQRMNGLCPRRTVLDKILVDHAVESGADLRENFIVEDLTRDADGRVTGLTGRSRDGGPVTESAALVIAADGLHSKLARLLEPVEYNYVDSLICGYYTYWSGIEHNGGIEVYVRPGAGAALFFPTNDDTICLVAGRPHRDFDMFKRDVEGMYISTLENVHPEVAQRMSRGHREERIVGAGDLPHFFRKPYGPGWVLVGDAGLHLDPMQGLGITKAFSEVSMLAPALIDGLSGKRPLKEALAEYHDRRDEQWVPLALQNIQASSALTGDALPRLVPWKETPHAREAAPV
jgi:flavin-dependent dehydrogenase